MDQRKTATIFTAIIFLAACAFLYWHFEQPTVSETIITECYYIESLNSPKTKVENSNFDIKVTATQGTQLFVEITNNTSKEIHLDENTRLYRASYDGTRTKVEDEGTKISITRGAGRAEIVKKIPAGGTRETVYECTSVGKFTDGAFIVRVNGQYVFFAIEPNITKES